MAERRMFTKKVTDDDNFLSLSSSAQALYLHLSMSADDDGFCNQVSISMFKAHASVQDLQTLLEKNYIYQFENGVIVIKHWRMANTLRKDRYTPTAFQEEFSKLNVKDNGSYSFDGVGCQMVAERLPQYSIGKNSIDKSNINGKPIRHKFGEYGNVLLSDADLEKLKTEFPADYEERIERLSSYIASTGKKYKNHLATIRNWARKEATTNSSPQQSKSNEYNTFMAELAAMRE